MNCLEHKQGRHHRLELEFKILSYTPVMFYTQLKMTTFTPIHVVQHIFTHTTGDKLRGSERTCLEHWAALAIAPGEG